MIYLDNAATTFPKPINVVNSVSECLKKYSANPGRSGHNLSIKASDKVFECRKKIKKLFNAKLEENIIFTSSCTVAINMVLKGVLKKGDHVICSSLEHNAVIRPLNKLISSGIEYDIARVFPDDFASTVRSFEALIKPNTKMIICTNASNVFGVVLPIEELGKLCKSYDLLFTVDAAQSAGILNIDTKKCNIDYLCVAAHKGLYAPMGIGILIANNEIEDTIFEGGTGSMSKLPHQPDFMPDKFESGTINLSGIIGTSAGIDFINRKGIGKIYNKELNIIRKIYYSLNKIPNIKLYTICPYKDYYVPVLSFNIKDMESEEVSSKLNKFNIATRPGFHCAPLAHKMFGTFDTGTVRVCPSVYTNDNDIEYFINKIKIIAK